jgi:hypothetical protein
MKDPIDNQTQKRQSKAIRRGLSGPLIFASDHTTWSAKNTRLILSKTVLAHSSGLSAPTAHPEPIIFLT